MVLCLITLLSKASSAILLFVLALTCSIFPSTEASDPLDPYGNITITWNLMNWTADGYVAAVTVQNFNQYRQIIEPGWSLGWAWANKEVIRNMIGAKVTEQGNCSKFTGNIPLSCKKHPIIVDLPPSTPSNQKTPHCCKGGVLSSWLQDPNNSAASFQVTVGAAGTTNRTVRVPRNFTLKAPGPGYVCGPAWIVRRKQFILPDKRRATQALMTWKVTCTYSQFLVQNSCCVSFSSFYNGTFVPCPKCSCGCKGNSSSCADHFRYGLADHLTGLGQCTSLRCPIQFHWHVEANYKDYWQVKINITNFNYGVNYSDWNLVIHHSNIGNVTNLFGSIRKPLASDGAPNDTAMLWGMKSYNDVLNQVGRFGTIQTEILIGKNGSNNSLEKGWAFPEKIYFNGDNCVMPVPPSSDAYPLTSSPENASAGFRQQVSLLTLIMSCLVALFFYTYA